MSLSSIALFTLGTAIVQAQVATLPDLTKLPSCAQTTAVSGISATGCQLTNITCICKSPAFLQAIGTQIAASCNEEDQKSTVEFANSVCEPLGISVPTNGLGDGKDDDDAATDAADAAAPDDESSDVPEAAPEPSASIETETPKPPYPIPSNGTNGTYGNGTALPFEGAAVKSDAALSAVSMVLLIAAGFTVL